MSRRKYKRLMVAGEWDRFHEGHKTLIRKALEYADEINLVIYEWTEAHTEATSYLDIVQPYKERARNVKNFIRKLGCEDRVTFYEHIEGESALLESPAIYDVETLIICEKDLKNICMQDAIAEGIELRRKRGIRTKPPEIIKTVKDESGADISSSKLRKREYIEMKRRGAV